MSETTHNVEILDLLEELDWRGLLKDCTDREGLKTHLSDPTGASRKIYAGFDPTADSLTIGNLVPIMLLAHVRRAGHTPVVVMGGGTGLIGDPSGKSAERQLNTPEIINRFIDKQRPIYSAVLGEEGTDFELRNNYDWLSGISYIEALRDIGKHFSVNMMMQKESVKERLTNREQGISYTEFSYMILQAYDFAWLYENANVTVQFGGSDQYGNIVAGSDLIRRTAQDNDDELSKSFGLTAPLVQKADGGKFGKTESGAVWLTAARTSPYAYYQFWLNASDEDAKNWIRVFTFVTRDEVESLIARHDEAPGRRELQRTLAQQATSILHGQGAMENAEAAGKALFSGEVASLDQSTLVEVFASVPTTEHAKADLDGEGVDPIELLIECNLASSKREAREFLGENSVSINGEKINGETRIVASHLLHGSYIAIRRGKKKWHMTQWS